jgi:hypothetical protein
LQHSKEEIMPLCTPTIVSPVSELSKSLRVQGALPGATILVVSVGANPRDIAKDIASGGDDRISLLPGVTLQNDDILIALQELGGDKSPKPPKSLGLSVQDVPSAPGQLGHVGFLSHLYKCGEYLWITGAIPGTKVEVEFNGSTKGSAIALEDGARLKLSEGLPAGTVTASQSIPAGKGPSVLGQPDSVTLKQLPPPTIKQPVLGCQTAVLISNVYDGATVTLQRDSGIVDVAGFDSNALWFRLSKPLDKGDTISVKQNLWVKCEQNSVFSPKVPVDKPQGVPAPVIIPPLCSGARFVRVANLTPGALVSIQVNGTKYSGMAPPNSAMYDFMVDPLPSGSVTAMQELCSVSSPQSSPAVKVDPQKANIPGVKLLEPLYACSRAVFVEGVHPGAILQVWRTDSQTGKKAAISSFVAVYDTQATIPVTPYLREKDKIWVLQWACNDTPIESNTAEVLQHPKIDSPIIVEPVYSGTTSVGVSNAVPGSLVEVYLSTQDGVWELAGTAFASPKSTSAVALNTKLAVGNKLRVSQSLCELKAQSEKIATVIRPVPALPILDSPPQGATGVDRKPTLLWHENPGNSKDGGPDIDELEVRQGSTVIVPLTPVTGQSFQIATELNYATNYTWKVRAKNTSGTSGFASSSFTVKPEPPPPPPVIDSYDQNTLTLKGKNFLPSHTVYVRLQMGGIVIIPSSGKAVADLRLTINLLQFTSDSAGNLSAVIDPFYALPPLPLDTLGNYLFGCVAGEKLSFDANDGRQNSSNNTLWSNKFTITWS